MSAPAKTEPAEGELAAPAAAKGGGSMMPLILVIVLVPALCYGVTNFLLVPKLKAAAGEAAPAAEHAEKGHGAGHGAAGGHGKKEAGKGGKSAKTGEHTAEFGTTIVNLTGTGGSRYLRTNFFIASSDPNIEELIRVSQNALRDTAIGVLSAQSLPGLDAPGGRNVVRNELISQFNRTLGGEVIEQIYFSEFVIQ